MNTYQQYCRLHLDASPIGLEPAGQDFMYPCTPKGAEIFGRCGVDGIHFCFVHGLGELVFVVSPMEGPDDYVHPVAASFSDFLRLLLACGDTAFLAQAHFFPDQAHFDAFLAENPILEEQQAVLSRIADALNLTPMEQPFASMRELQAAFDYSQLQPSEKPDDIDPPECPTEWAVYFEGNFWGSADGQQAGAKLSIEKTFCWAEKQWYTPAVYLCDEGLVLDFCMQVVPENIRAFAEKWELELENDEFTDQQHRQIEEEQPLSVRVNPELMVNEQVLPLSHSSGLCWNPCFPEQNDVEAEAVVRHYELDSAYGWSVYRAAFPWPTADKPDLSSLRITLRHDPVTLFGTPFEVSAPGDVIGFTHPVTQVQHTLTVQRYEPQELPEDTFPHADYDYPRHCTSLSYTLSPPLAEEDFSLSDLLSNDSPRAKNPQEDDEAGCFAVFFTGTVGDSDRARPFGAQSQGACRTVYSALHFDPVDRVEWHLEFFQTPYPDYTLSLL